MPDLPAPATVPRPAAAGTANVNTGSTHIGFVLLPEYSMIDHL